MTHENFFKLFAFKSYRYAETTANYHNFFFFSVIERNKMNKACVKK